MAPLPLFQTVFWSTVWPAALLFWSTPHAELPKDRQFTSRCGVAVPLPPSLNPLPLPLNCVLFGSQTLVAARNAQQLVINTGCVPIHKSQLSSEFSHARQPLNTLPGPRLHFAVKPSAFPPTGGS